LVAEVADDGMYRRLAAGQLLVEWGMDDFIFRTSNAAADAVTIGD
jgi:hypothetical protein